MLYCLLRRVRPLLLKWKVNYIVGRRSLTGPLTEPYELNSLHFTSFSY